MSTSDAAMIVELTQERDNLLDVIKLLRRGSCWCEKAIGNPLYKDHTLACKAAKIAVGEA